MLGVAFLLVGVATRRPVSASTDRAVEIATMPCDGRLQATSSGFVVGEGRVVTVAHALFESRDFAVRGADDRWYRPTVRYMDLERDLAVLEHNAFRAEPITMTRAERGEPVRMAAGAATGTTAGSVERPVNITTLIVGSNEDTSDRRGYELNVEIGPGDSGAAIVDADDELVAVVFARSTRRPGVSWATASEEVDQILDQTGVPTWRCGPTTGADLVLPTD